MINIYLPTEGTFAEETSLILSLLLVIQVSSLFISPEDGCDIFGYDDRVIGDMSISDVSLSLGGVGNSGEAVDFCDDIPFLFSNSCSNCFNLPFVSLNSL